MQPIVLRQVAESLSVIIDLMSPVLANHQLRVAHIAGRLAESAGMIEAERQELVLAALLHDCGALSISEREKIKKFEFDLDEDRARQHAEAGFRLLRDFEPFTNVANVVRYHHRPWGHGKGQTVGGEAVPQSAQIVHLADRIDVLLDYRQDLLTQVETVEGRVRGGAGPQFDPQLVDLFVELSTREYFWFDLEAVARHAAMEGDSVPSVTGIQVADLLGLAKLFSRMIDFRSRFTATHSQGVAACVGKLAELLGMEGEERQMLVTAGYLHDLGKLAVPRELIEKKGPLTLAETSLLKRHSFYSYWILRRIGGLEKVADWAACHHERINGKGYPFHYKGERLSTGARALAVADVFTAVMEDRPYRKGMAASNAIKVLERMAMGGVLDVEIVQLLFDHFGEINQERAGVQQEAMCSYSQFCLQN
jgi:putative nucleotidyltransferase with HDIG domain